MGYDVIGIGNALMDILVSVEDDKLSKMNIKKGTMKLVDAKEIDEIEKSLDKREVKTAAGGSVANTVYGVSALGGSAVFAGKVGNDEHGLAYEQKMIEAGVKSRIARKEGSTGRVVTFITPDTERTFATHLGVACELEKDELFIEDIRNSKVLHVGGYELESPVMKKAVLHAMDAAKAAGVKISIDLADPGLVGRNLNEMTYIVKRYADIVFANEEEAKAFTGKTGKEALHRIAEVCEIAVVKLGARGSLIKESKEGGRVFEIPGLKVNAVDTTGAGDSYAAGFLYGLTQGMSLERCGKIGSWIASKVVSQIGARLEKIDRKEIEKIINK